MKVRRAVAMGVGMALGAGAMYVLDPEAGRRRRREVLRSAGAATVRRVRERDPRREVLAARKRAARTVETLAASARAGFLDGRQGPPAAR